MKLNAKLFDIEAGGPYIILLNEKIAKELDLFSSDRVRVLAEKRYVVAIVDIAKKLKNHEVGIFNEVRDALKINSGEIVSVVPEEPPSSLGSIKKKLDKKFLTREEMCDIITDTVDNVLTAPELAYFVSAAYTHGFSMAETEYLTRAMAETGEMLKWNKRPIMDKHCIGGVAGNRTTMLLVPIITAAGLTMPKTSSRSITSPAGTADTMEVLANVSFDISEIQSIVNKTGGCIVWGGALNLAPADDIIVKTEHSLELDPTPMLLASIMAKKYVAGATHVLIDIPVGRFAKCKTLARYKELKIKFEQLGKRLKMKIKIIKTEGEEPIGNGLGPALEARDVMWILHKDKRGPESLKKKALMMAGLLLEMGGKARPSNGIKLATEILESGKALKKMQEIIAAQGGNPKIIPEKIKIGKFSYDFLAKKSGKITIVNDDRLTRVARLAGSPRDKGAGVYLYTHFGYDIKKGDKLFTIYAESERKLDEAYRFVVDYPCIEIDGR